ncbi:hypothetical protein VNO77_28876 [Canavalia gladiata]|uniref:Alpha-carbonic anhydrase domain-containing protein n=1 Tax=Canavalia gladiata TaxID=3824 RepID=A0AAN9KXN1_CANGL
MCREAGNEEDFNYELSSKKGPLHWGNIQREWSVQKWINAIPYSFEGEQGHCGDQFRASDKIENELKSIAENKDKEISLGIVNPQEITGPPTTPNEYFRYNGSLTAPPCQENVVWTVFTKAKTVAKSQIKMLRVAVKDEKYTNERPLQPRHRRPVQLYKPKDN